MSRYYAEPNDPNVIVSFGNATGFTLGVGTFELYNLETGASIDGPRNTGITKPRPDVVVTVITAPATKDIYGLRWVRDDGTAGEDELEVTSTPPALVLAPPVAEPFYASAAELRDDLEVDIATLSDAKATKILVEAEDLIDRLIGPKAPDLTTGRKYTVPGAGWDALAVSQRAALKRATVFIAAELYNNPDAFTPAAVSGSTGLVKGPDFELRSPLGGSPQGRKTLIRVAAILDSANLRVLTARMRDQRSHPAAC